MILAVLWIYVGIVAVIAALQRQLLFFPTRESESVMLANAAVLGMEPWRSATGEIIGWKMRAKPGIQPANKLVVFHGNAGHALHRDDYALGFERLGAGGKWEVWLFEYPGYGARSGEPGRESFAKAARAALAELRSRDARPLFLLGESLGAGVASDLAAEPANAIAGLVLITPWASLADAARMHFPLLPVRLILRDRWDNIAALEQFRRPVAVLIAGRDEIVSAAQGNRLFEKLGAPKRRWLFADASHNDSDIQRAEWAGEVSDFLLGPTHAKR